VSFLAGFFKAEILRKDLIMTETTEPENKAKALARVETSVCGLVLNTLEDMKTVAQIILQSKLAPESFKTSEQIFVGLQTGAEIGLKPMQALNSIVVIKGKPTLWGDAPLGLVKRSGLCEYCKEYFELDDKEILAKDIQYTDIKEYPNNLIAVCETKRKDAPEPVLRYFSVADAKLAGLWGKPGSWTTHPKRMLPYKARAFNLRDNFPDVLFGMHLTEEMYGEEPLPAPESDVPPREERRSLAVPSSTVDTTRVPVQEAEPAPDAEEKPDKQEPEPAVEEETKTDDVKELYIEVNGMYVAQGGADFVEFAAYVLCLDESEISLSKLTIEQLKQIEAYIETNGVAIA